MPAPAPSAECLHYDSSTGLRIGSFRRYPWQRPFEDTGPIGGFLLVFPRSCVLIQHAGRPPVVADPTRVMLYNRGQEYRRRALSDRGDECEWFAFPAPLVAAAVGAHDPSVADRLDRPFAATHAPIDTATYLFQRRIVEHIARRPRPDRLFVEESMMRLIERCTRDPSAAPPPRRPATADDHRAIAETARAHLARRLGESPSLFDVATHVGVSPFHLARVFRRETGTTVHAYLNELRLRTALERVMGGDDLTRVAIDLGYASHSHFTSLFRRAFGATPSALRARS